MTASAAELKRWVEARRLAEAREQLEQIDAAPDPVMALERGLAIIELAAELNPSRSADGALTAEDLAAYQHWARVRTALRVA